MADVVWWIDPPKNISGGGYITEKLMDDEVDEVNTSNYYVPVGFVCEKQNGFPLDLITDAYENWEHNGYIRFDIPTYVSASGFSNASLYLRMASYELAMNDTLDDMAVDVWSRGELDPTDFPWSTLQSDDWEFGEYTKELYSSDDFDTLIATFESEGSFWIGPIDVTDAFEDAIDNGWDRVGIRLVPSKFCPDDWSYANRPTDYDQKALIRFYGPSYNGAPIALVAAPSGFATASCYPCPWVAITYTPTVSGLSLPEQGEPGEDATPASGQAMITCVAADSKARSALIGSDTGSLWYCWDGGDTWTKVHEFDSAVTAIWMDPTINFIDYPTTQVTWVGCADGKVFKSVNSLQSWYEVMDSIYSIIEIQGSEVNPNRVAVAVSSGIYITLDGGENWSMPLTRPTLGE